YCTTMTRRPSSSRCPGTLPDLPSFPTRRSSDLVDSGCEAPMSRQCCGPGRCCWPLSSAQADHPSFPAQLKKTDDRPEQKTMANRDRKSTRLNSSHVAISYAVFCLKKKEEK